MNSFFLWIVSTEKMSYVGEFAATIWICYNLQIQKRIVSAETIPGNTVCVLARSFGYSYYHFHYAYFLIRLHDQWSLNDISMFGSKNIVFLEEGAHISTLRFLIEEEALMNG